MIYLKIGEKLYVNYVIVLISLTYIFKFISLISKYYILPTLEYLLTDHSYEIMRQWRFKQQFVSTNLFRQQPFVDNHWFLPPSHQKLFSFKMTRERCLMTFFCSNIINPRIRWVGEFINDMNRFVKADIKKRLHQH